MSLSDAASRGRLDLEMHLPIGDFARCELRRSPLLVRARMPAGSSQ